MSPKPSLALESLTALSVAKCLLRISRVSAGTWHVLGTKVAYGSLRDALKLHDFTRPASAVYFTLPGAAPLTGIMLFDRADMACVSECFTGHAFPRSAATTPAEEIMLTELGNIVLNAVMSTLLNALKKSFMPAVPRFTEGGIEALIAEFKRIPKLQQDFRNIAVTVEMRTDKAAAKSELLVLLPEELALELENLRPPAGSHDGLTP
ncbi:MAG: hypothetical protein NDI60_04220 [Elusimicrobiales bacterium]|nr:hypothetical protein [Elusimicrobiales bacterium]